MLSALRRNSIWLLLARLSGHGLAVLFIVLAARRLSVEVFGQFTVIAALIIIGNSFTTFGTDTFLIREIARAGQVSSLVSRALGLQLGLSALWWSATLFLRPDPPLLVYSLSLFPLALIAVLSALLRAYERMDLSWVISLINGIVQLLAVFFSDDLWTLCAYVLLGQLVVAVLTLWICYRSLPRFQLFPSIDFIPLLRVVWPFAAITTLAVFSQRLGILSVSALEGDLATGLFSSAVRTVEGLKFGHYAVLGALLPELSRDAARSRRGFHVGLLGLLGISVLLAVGVRLLARPIMSFLFGQAYEPASGLLSILCWSLVPYTISAFISVDLVARGRELDLLKAMLFTMLLFFVLYLFMINLYGLLGAAWAAFMGELFQAGILVWVAKKFISDVPTNVTNTNEIL